MGADTLRKVKGYCGFCAVHCPVVTAADGARVLSVEPDREHPYGGAICSKGRAAPEFHDHRERVNVPLPSLRKTAPNPTAEIHPDTAQQFAVTSGEWIVVETPSGRVRAQAHVTDTILPGVVCCSHGWWEACPELGLPGFDPFTEAGANQNLLVHNDQHDPVSGGTPHRSTLCRVIKTS